MSTMFRKRKYGSQSQIGKAFPIRSDRPLNRKIRQIAEGGNVYSITTYKQREDIKFRLIEKILGTMSEEQMRGFGGIVTAQSLSVLTIPELIEELDRRLSR